MLNWAMPVRLEIRSGCEDKSLLDLEAGVTSAMDPKKRESFAVV